MYYTYATAHLEDVRAVIKAPPGRCWDEDAVFPAWVETPDGKTVCKGTVSIGAPPTPNYVRGLPLESAPAGANRIAAAVKVGDRAEAGSRISSFEAGEDGIVRDPQAMYGALMSNFLRGQIAQPAVGFFGATEIAAAPRPDPHRHALREDRPRGLRRRHRQDRVRLGRLRADRRSGRLIAEMRHLTRWMKASSPLWKA